MNKDKVYFNKGDIVKLDLDNSPEMIVSDISILRRDSEVDGIVSMIDGIECRWFNGNKDIVKSIFDFKDLRKVRVRS